MGKGWQEEEGDGSRRGENVENSLDKRARIDASTTILRRKDEEGIRRERESKIAVSARTAISTYASSATIEDWGSFWVIGPHAPVIVLD
jgi:hypothetical protein